MLWTTLRWNWGNALAVAAFCALPLITLSDRSGDKAIAEATPAVALQHANFEVAAPFAQNRCGADLSAADRSGCAKL